MQRQLSFQCSGVQVGCGLDVGVFGALRGTKHSLAVHVLVGEAVQGGVQLCRRGPLIQAQRVQVGQKVPIHLGQDSISPL